MVETAKEDIKTLPKDISATFSAVGLTRLKRAGACASGTSTLARELAGKSSHPTNDVKASQAGDDQSLEGRTASIIVRKLLDKFQGLIARSEAVRGYANDVRKTLIEVETQLQERALAPLRRGARSRGVCLGGARAFRGFDCRGRRSARCPAAGSGNRGEPLERESRAYAQSARQSREEIRGHRESSPTHVNALVAAKTEAIDRARRICCRRSTH